MTESRDSGQSGAVLVELLAALAIMAVIATMMMNFFGQFRVLGRITQEVATQSEMDTAIDHIKRTLSLARNVNLTNGDQAKFVSFSGNSGAIRFSSVTRRGFYSMALRRVRIYIEPHGDRYRLVQTLAPMRFSGNQPFPPVVRVVLQDDITSLKFEFSDSNGKYLDRWVDKPELPSLVRITVVRAVGNSKVATTAVARLD